MSRARARAIWAAYADTDMTQPCPTCKASADTWCTNEITGRVRRVPCVDRPRKPAPAGQRLFTGATKKSGRDHLRVVPENEEHDFSEPRHPPAGGAL